MYLRITSKCNMKCAHCCMSCEPGKGEHMTLTTYRQALQVVRDCGGHVVLGGGEPTMHPHFETMLLESLTVSEEDMMPLVVTNGTHKRRALMLALLNKRGVVSAELSTDYHHDVDMVDPEVYEAFEGNYRDVSGKEVHVGRYLEVVSLDWDEVEHTDCACDDWIVEPDGTIRQCACHDAPIVGNVKGEGIFPKYQNCSGMCFHSGEFEEAMEEFNEMIEAVA